MVEKTKVNASLETQKKKFDDIISSNKKLDVLDQGGAIMIAFGVISFIIWMTFQFPMSSMGLIIVGLGIWLSAKALKSRNARWTDKLNKENSD